MFERERRYYVLKWSDVQQTLTIEEQNKLFVLAAKIQDYRETAGKVPFDTFTLESDWPEFDIAVDMVRRRMEGLPTREAELLKDYAERLADYKAKADAVIRNLKEQIASEHGLLLASCPETCRCEEYPVGTIQTYVAVLERQIEKMKEAIGLHLTYHEHGCAYLDEFASDNVEYQGPDAESIVTFNARQPGMQTMKDLSMLVALLSRAVTNSSTRGIHEADKDTARKAMDYLKRKGLQGSPLREGQTDTTTYPHRFKVTKAEVGSWSTSFTITDMDSKVQIPCAPEALIHQIGAFFGKQLGAIEGLEFTVNVPADNSQLEGTDE